jgi:ubiquinone/menaquinone biosynthesis C-methylase UbiE
LAAANLDIMESYYSDRLSANRLQQCYEIAPPRVRQYLNAEIEHVLKKLHPGDMVLELGCGYGRVMEALSGKAGLVVGIDTSFSSLLLANRMLSYKAHCNFAQMDAVRLAFPDRIFDAVVCIQNGISAFHVDQRALIRESVRMIRDGGMALFSSYAKKFWSHRLQWFQLQSGAGLLGEIDYEKTGNGAIVCKDGFTATTVTAGQFASLTADLSANVQIIEVDESSLFCEIKPLRPESSDIARTVA